MGAGYTVFVAKHCTGFISWQSDAYPYGVHQSKWRDGKGDVVADYVASCRKSGIQPGVYCSMPANAHCEVFDNCMVKGASGPTDPRQVEYRRRAERLVTELWGNYGPLAYVWFDGGTLPPEKGGPDLVPILKRLQPHAVTFQGPPDNPAGNTRWPGNEQGVTSNPSWSTVAQANEPGGGNPSGKVWQPGECDAPLRNQDWFWHPHHENKVRSVDELVELYYGSVGRGCNLILNGNINRDGLVPEADLKRLKEFGDEIRRRFGKSIAETSGRGKSVELELGRPTVIDNVIIMEQITEGERVREYVLEGLADGRWMELAHGQSIGHKRIERFHPVELTKVRLRVTEALAEPIIRKLAVYHVERRDGQPTDKSTGVQPLPGEFGPSIPPPQPTALDSALRLVSEQTRALVLLDARLHKLIASDLSSYIEAASARRGFRITVLPIVNLDDYRPPDLRRAIQGWKVTRPRLEGILFVGNVKLPSFFMPRADTPATRLWPRYYEDIDMTAQRRIPPGTVLKECGPANPWPCVAGMKRFTVPEHDFDDLAQGPSRGPQLWAAFLPVGYQDDAKNNYHGWANQLRPFFKKALAFYQGAPYGHGLYLVSNDVSCLARSKPVWDAVGPKEIEFYAINEKGPAVYKNNPAGYLRVDLTKYRSLEEFLAYANKLPWMDEGWQSAEVFLRHMSLSRRRFVWWNVHSNPEISLVSNKQALTMNNGGLIALLNGCAVGGLKQPGSRSYVDVQTTAEKNVLVSVVYGRSAFLAALGTPHNRVDDEHATPLFEHMYSGGYLGMVHLLRLKHQDKASHETGVLRTRQEMLIGDPFVDAR
jgi:alpha-L-fucosidase